MPTGTDGFVIGGFRRGERLEEIIIADIGARGLADLLRMTLAKFVQPPSLTMR
ncbi:hypothetical protein [Bradyrhizobium neotropicale]|uniref:hypothetical protein n=1 Tax=Bradyrhizobium neotropicale TaxID=1497615 RepID=UPI001AD6A088|nr:hypothetical protein [Bradyrhizobium neotropicale]